MAKKKNIQILNIEKKLFTFMICRELHDTSVPFQVFSDGHTLKFLKVKCNPTTRKNSRLKDLMIYKVKSEKIIS